MMNKKLKIYIAGKITGDENYKAKFEEKQKELEKQGFIVLNPAILPQGMRIQDYMRICFAMIDVADEAYFLSDWRDSKGANLEFKYCIYTHKNMLLECKDV